MICIPQQLTKLGKGFVMKKSLTVLLCSTTFFCFDSVAQVYSPNIVGYVNQVWPADGYLLINNPLGSPNNTVSGLFDSVSNGTTVELWDAGANAYTAASLKGPGGWTINYDLFPGTGARLYSPVNYTNTYVGEVLDGDGVTAVEPIDPPSPFDGPDGIYLLGTIAPVAILGEDVFLWTLGRGPNAGESITTLNPLTQMYSTTTYLGVGLWDNGTPSLSVAESAFFTIPEPTTFTLLGLGSLALVMVRRRSIKVGFVAW